jgi:hypothetical protein
MPTSQAALVVLRGDLKYHVGIIGPDLVLQTG